MSPLPKIPQYSELAPNFTMKIGEAGSVPSDEVLPGLDDAKELIEEVSYESSTEICDKMVITCNNPENVILENNLFPEGAIVDIFMGYGGVHEFIGRAELLRWLPSFGRSEMPSFTVEGLALENVFMRNDGPDESAGETWTFGKDALASDVITEILSRKVYTKYKFKTNITPTKVKRMWNQKKGQNDWQFMKLLAAFHDFDLWVESDETGDTVVFAPMDDSASSEGELLYKSGYESHLLDFDPEWGFEDIPTAVEVVTVDKKTGELSVQRVETVIPDSKAKRKSKPKPIVYGSSVYLGVYGERVMRAEVKSGNAQAAAQAAVAQFRTKLKNFFVGTGHLSGHPYFKARQIWTLGGLGDRLNNDYYFHRVKHTMNPDSIYEVDFGARLILPPEVAYE